MKARLYKYKCPRHIDGHLYPFPLPEFRTVDMIEQITFLLESHALLINVN